MSEPQLAVTQRMRQLQAIYGAFAAAIFLYTLVLGFNLRGSTAVAAVNALRPALALAAVMFACGSIWWRRRAIRAMQFISPEQLADGSSFELLRTNCIITWGLTESVAVMGLAIGVLTHDIGAFAPYAAAALALLTIHRPSAWPLWPAAQS